MAHETMTDPRSLPSTRITDLFPLPAKGYALPELPPGKVDLRHLGFRLADPETIHRIRGELAPYPWPESIYVFAEERGAGLWLFREMEGRHYLIPYCPFEPIPFEPGDEVYDLGWEVPVYEKDPELNTKRLRLGKILERSQKRSVKILWEPPDPGPKCVDPNKINLRPTWMATRANNRQRPYPFAPRP